MRVLVITAPGTTIEGVRVIGFKQITSPSKCPPTNRQDSKTRNPVPVGKLREDPESQVKDSGRRQPGATKEEKTP